MPWYLNPFTLRDAAREAQRLNEGGGPRGVRLRGLGRPEGCFLPTTTIGIDVVAADGSKSSFDPELPVPLLLAYGYRLGRWACLPVLADVDPGRLRLSLGRTT